MKNIPDTAVVIIIYFFIFLKIQFLFYSCFHFSKHQLLNMKCVICSFRIIKSQNAACNYPSIWFCQSDLLTGYQNSWIDNDKNRIWEIFTNGLCT